MIHRLVLLTVFFCTSVVADYHKLKLGGACEALRVELEGTDDAAAKMTKLNAFLDTLGEGIRQKFWDIVAAAKTDAQTNLPSDKAKELAGEVISDFEQGNLFKSHQEISAEVREIRKRPSFFTI